MPERHWVSAHLYYHGDQDVLIADVVRPVTDGLRRDGLAEGFFFLRYWEGGPHVRLRLLTEHAEQVRARIEAAAAAFYRSTPSRMSMSTVDYNALAATLAEQEGLADHDRVLHRDNSLEFIDYVPETDRYGTGRALAAVEDHMMAASTLAVELIGLGRSAGQRAMDAFAMLAANRTLHTDIFPEFAYQSRFLAENRGAATAVLGSPEFERHYAANRDQLRGRLEAVWATAQGEAPPDTPVLAHWLDTVRTLHATLIELDERGALDVDAGLDAPEDVLDHINHLVPQLILEQCAHLMCNRLGLTQLQELHLRVLLARTAFDRCAV
jgi:thiopeptide-type bacteriocin biosynthesis protein